MSNSALASYTNLTKNCSKPRNHKIDKITIHHMAGFMTAKACADYFATTTRKVSSNYCIGTDGKIAVSVEEKDRAWTSSNAENDNRAVTIEVANSTGAPEWKISERAMKSLIDLCADICIRNGIEKLSFTGNKNGNLTMHKYFAATECPGPYLSGKFSYIAQEVNKILESEKSKMTEEKKTEEPKKTVNKSSFLPPRGYFQKGDYSVNVGKIAAFMRKVFPSYTHKKALGNTYGDYIISAVKEFQRRTGLTPDGYFGQKTLAELEKYGFSG